LKPKPSEGRGVRVPVCFQRGNKLRPEAPGLINTPRQLVRKEKKATGLEIEAKEKREG